MKEKRFTVIKGVIKKQYDPKYGELYMASIDHPEFDEIYEYSHKEKTAKEGLKKEVENLIKDGLYYRKLKLYIITTNGGEIIVLWRVDNETWAYEVLKEGRSRGRYIFGSDTPEEAIETAKTHAEQVYGGIDSIAQIKL